MSNATPTIGYEVKFQRVGVGGGADLQIRSLLDKQQFFDPLGLAFDAGISSATWPLFGLVWPSAQKLADLMQTWGSHPAQLSGFIQEHAAEGAEVLIVDPNRGNRSAFHKDMANMGFGVTELLMNEPLQDLSAYRGRLLHYKRS
jgi:hypothetical protein